MNAVTLRSDKIVRVSPDMLPKNMSGTNGKRLMIECADGTYESTVNDVIYNAYAWMIPTHFNLPIKKSYTIRNYISDTNDMGAYSPIKLFEHISMDVIKTLFNKKPTTATRDKVLREMSTVLWNANAALFKNTVNDFEKYQHHVNYTDLIALVFEPKVVALREEVVATYKTNPDIINHNKDLCEKMFMSDFHLSNGKLCKVSELCRLGVFKVKQVINSVFLKGWVIEVDKTRDLDPILDPLLLVSKVSQIGLLTRDNALSSLAIKKDLGQVSVMKRTLDAVVRAIRWVDHKSCRTKMAISIEVQEDDLPHLDGVNYFRIDKNGNKIEEGTITPLTKHVIGKSVYIKNPIYCECSGGTVCSTCIGTLAETQVSNRGLGITVSTAPLQGAFQGTMSLKHLMDLLKATFAVTVNANLVKSNNTGDIYLHKKNAGTINKLMIHIPTMQAKGLSNIFGTISLSQIPIDRLTRVQDISLYGERSKSTLSDELLNIGTSKKPMSISLELLKFIKEKGPTKLVIDGAFFKIDITDYDVASPLFVQTHTYVTDHKAYVTDLVKGIQSTVDKNITDPADIAGRLMRIYQMSKDAGMPIHLSVIGIMLRPYIISKNQHGVIDWSIQPAQTPGAYLGHGPRVRDNRALSSRLYMENQLAHLLSPDRLSREAQTKYISSSSLDVMFTPKETILRG